MGNFTSCYNGQPRTAILIDSHGNLRRIKVPITAAEIMLDDPGHVVSPAQQIRRNSRIPAMKADDELSAGKAYLLVPAGRSNCKVSESEMALIDSASGGKRRLGSRSSKVLPAASTEGSGGDEVEVENSLAVLQGNDTGLAGHRLVSPRHWRFTPVLETISEGL
ncbi:hypothetical protein LOK49_LG12G00996 [Camellia lanceoleosa]|uniref:Uncharacterized protein n=1 Tax=Camellia lanceoleosa TaxID=1840588 RepID=A0ACC0FNI0_9ERIC|nr:hypothetical protein LOK49_LG12G00996 [Camellia lanceoleosa]